MHHHYGYGDEERSEEKYADDFDSAFDHFDKQFASKSPFDTAEEEFGCLQEGDCEDAAAVAKDSSLDFAGDGENPYQRAEEYLVSLLEELSVRIFIRISVQFLQKTLFFNNFHRVLHRF